MPQSRPGPFEEEKSPFPLPGIESRFLGYLARYVFAILAELSGLPWLNNQIAINNELGLTCRK